jgi:hypothetical protein
VDWQGMFALVAVFRASNVKPCTYFHETGEAIGVPLLQFILFKL